MNYFISKSSRYPETPYTGPSCEKPGVEPGKIYRAREDAERDVQKLSQINPVGFVVNG